MRGGSSFTRLRLGEDKIPHRCICIHFHLGVCVMDSGSELEVIQ
jgi:hypothetical protein